ncbi:17265_t:CDS:2 [Dentiscutata erythropus]|uniref:17265_t:CDS:1 n=1 Tax=Dentiscutata erythropus TaxID=1348616 RepID=A0A9N9CG92_9GLOM|nr:17265_t:CDS:2 [Dentiscutata erythropus]
MDYIEKAVKGKLVFNYDDFSEFEEINSDGFKIVKCCWNNLNVVLKSITEKNRNSEFIRELEILENIQKIKTHPNNYIIDFYGITKVVMRMAKNYLKSIFLGYFGEL